MQIRSGDITELLAGWREGDRAALDRLMPLIRAELDRLARRHLGRERKNHTMQRLSVEEAAEVLCVAPNTVIRDWNFARAWLRRELGGAGTADHGTLATN